MSSTKVEHHASLIYAAASCNRGSQMLAISRNNISIFGSNSLIALLMPLDCNFKGIRILYNAHHQSITCLEFIYLSNVDKIPFGFISCSSDGEAIVWQFDLPSCEVATPILRWFPGEKNTKVFCISSMSVLSADRKILMAFGLEDNSVGIWELSLDPIEINEFQRIKTNQHFVLSVSLFTLSNDRKIIATGASDSKVRLYHSHGDSLFEFCFTLDGHDNWIRSLSLVLISPSSILLASASQDKSIRIWGINLNRSSSGKENDNILKLKTSRWSSSASDDSLEARLGSVLLGHDDWVYSCKWTGSSIQPCNDYDMITQNPHLLSSSSDGSIILWQQHRDTWISVTTLGDLNDTFGFYGAVITPDLLSIIGHSHSGSLHLWQRESISGFWRSHPMPTGHSAAISDISVYPDNKGILLGSVSQDSTTRIHAKCSLLPGSPWHEIARPQVHGYEMVSISWIPPITCSDISPPRFISAGDEKVCRIFEGTKAFMSLSTNLGARTFDPKLAKYESAQVSALGLTAKEFLNAIDEPCAKVNSSTQNSEFTKEDDIYSIPTENILATQTLWPEIERLYGHPNEIYTLAVSPDGRLVAATCKSNSPVYAGIRLWFIDRTQDLNSNNWTAHSSSPLLGHTLTVTKLIFSSDSKYLLSVSRDRSWIIYQISHSSINLLACQKNAHARVIWSACFIPTDEPNTIQFATISRDKSIKIWEIKPSGTTSCMDTSSSAITSLLHTYRCTGDEKNSIPMSITLLSNDKIGIGFEDGSISIMVIEKKTKTIDRERVYLPGDGHIGPITTLASWRDLSSSVIYIASGGEDHSLRIHSLEL